MEREEIEFHLPGIHSYLSPLIPAPDLWPQIHSDLSDLSWLSLQTSPEKVIFSLISICDRMGIFFLSSTPHFSIFSLPRVLLYINDSIYKVVTNKQRIKEICTTSKNLINEMKFFQDCSLIISDAQDSEVEEKVFEVERVYRRFKEVFADVTKQLEKSIQHEFDKSFVEVLDEVFFETVLKTNKERLIGDRMRGLMKSYKKERVIGGGYGYFNSSYKYEDIYIGEIQGGSRNGYGKLYYSYRDMYEGYWKNDKRHGKGIYTWKNGSKYCGDFKSGKFHGQGKKTYPSGSFYEGEFIKGNRSGKGFMRFKNGDTYQGQWKDDEMHGTGVYIWKSGDRFEGEFKKDKRDGKGTLTLNTGEVIEGVWIEGVQKKTET